MTAVVSAFLLTACTTSGGTGEISGSSAAFKQALRVCSGYGCVIKDKFRFSRKDLNRLKSIMASGKRSAAAERRAVARAIGTMERMARAKLRYRPDVKLSYIINSGKRGQMDCVDESLNTTGYLRYLHANGLLRHHTPDRGYAERGLIIDGRYPHKSASMRDKSGIRWTVDSWYKPDGKAAQIMKYSAWKRVRNSSSSYR